MIPRRIYYRKKGKSIIIEGKAHGKSILIWTLPKDPEKLLENMCIASYFTKEKWLEIDRKLRRLDYKTERKKKTS